MHEWLSDVASELGGDRDSSVGRILSVGFSSADRPAQQSPHDWPGHFKRWEEEQSTGIDSVHSFGSISDDCQLCRAPNDQLTQHGSASFARRSSRLSSKPLHSFTHTLNRITATARSSMSTLDGDNSPQASSSSRLSMSMSMPRIRSNTTLNVAHTPSASPTINNGAKINSALQYPEKAGRASPLPAATAAGAGASAVPPPPQPVNTVALVLLFVAALCVMIMLFRNFPTVAESVEWTHTHTCSVVCLSNRPE